LDQVVVVEHAEGVDAGVAGEAGAVDKSILKMDMRGLLQTLVSAKRLAEGYKC
jgi:hypothetical protein